MKAEIILSIVVASSTVIYTIINAFIWWESRATRMQKIAPHIVAYIKSGDSKVWTDLHIKNIGEGYAKNVTFRVIKDLNRFENENLCLANTSGFKLGISSFPPQYEIKYGLKSDSKVNDSDCLEFEIMYHNIYGRKITDNYRFNLKEIADQNYSVPPDSFIGQIAHYLKEIDGSIKKLR